MTINPTNANTLNQTAVAGKDASKQVPFNAVTGKTYFGGKASRLQEEGAYRNYTSHAWATMKQWNSIKETIAKGEKGTLVIHMEKKPDGSQEEKRSFLFNRCQLESFRDTNDKPF